MITGAESLEVDTWDGRTLRVSSAAVGVVGDLGVVVDRIDDSDLGVPGTVMRLTARVEHGNSGGPVLDERGRLVGIVYAIELATGFGLTIPVDTLRSLAQKGGLAAVPRCGAD